MILTQCRAAISLTGLTSQATLLGKLETKEAEMTSLGGIVNKAIDTTRVIRAPGCPDDRRQSC